MKKISLSLILLFMAVWSTGCSLAEGTPVQSSATPSMGPQWIQPTPFSSSITLDLLKNAEYPVKNGMALVTLVDGKYEAGSGADFISVSMLDQAAIGDLNADGIQDAAIILLENYGGTGQFEYLVPVFGGDGFISASSGYFLGDRVLVNSMKMEDGKITLEMLVQAPNDAMCCPSQSMTQSFRYYWGPGLILVNATSGTTANALREITIEAPARGSEITLQVSLKGSFTIAPFENTLLVNIFNMDDGGNYYQGPIMVSAPDMGAPGTFDAVIDLAPYAPSPGSFRIEVLEVSMADGSTLALDSVDVILK
jgi:hypothetical protein